MTTKFQVSPFQVGKTYKMRDGRDVRIIATDRLSPTYPIVGLVVINDEENTMSFTAAGKYHAGGARPEFDLVTTEERWINLLPLSTHNGFATRHDAKEVADRCARKGSIPATLAQVKITYTDGKPTGVELVPVGE